MNRKEFLKVTGLLVVGLPLVATVSCSSDSGSDNDGNGGGEQGDCDNGTSSAISNNHGHSLSVSALDVQNGVNKTYVIEGAANHSHNVIVTAANFQTLSTGQSVQLSSTSGGGHTHSITVSCA